jgi:hypothetical protein
MIWRIGGVVNGILFCFLLLGFSKKKKHLGFYMRYSLFMHNQWNLQNLEKDAESDISKIKCR